MHRLILLLYKEFAYVKITYIGVFLKLTYTAMLDEDLDVRVNIISVYRLDFVFQILLGTIRLGHFYR
jgi:hypothetical protein